MDERAALALLSGHIGEAGDDCAVLEESLLTTDMLHATTDFPGGTTRYTAGWRAVAASLSDVAAMGGTARAAVAVYAAPDFDEDELTAFVEGASDVCELVGATYVGGDLDTHEEFTAATTVLGATDEPVLRSGASPDEAVCVTGTLGRSAAALRLFERGDDARANELFRFIPRIAAGRAIGRHATAMMDSSDGLARSLHQLADASGCGMSVSGTLPVDESVEAVADDSEEAHELGVFFGEDFELVFTVPEDDLETVREDSPVAVTRIGTVVEDAVTLDGDPLPDRGFTHG
ncbi:thiamine-phosphate kinase [Halococcus sp. AFM35]|uniref:thiamine-phosphate kinase n=1 Tax=Halococcus sp. AFM35 TaxID=3421653 RepID=UPI003EBB6290